MLSTEAIKEGRNFLINQSVAKASITNMGGQVKVYVIDPKQLQQRLEKMVNNLSECKKNEESSSEATPTNSNSGLQESTETDKKTEKNKLRKRKRKQAREFVRDERCKAEEAAELTYLMKPPATTRVGRVSKSLNHVKIAKNAEQNTDSSNSLPVKVRKREPPEMFRCQACQKVYLGYTKLFLHFSKFPEHQLKSSMSQSSATTPFLSNNASVQTNGHRDNETGSKAYNQNTDNPPKQTADAEVQVQVHVVEASSPKQSLIMNEDTNPKSTILATNHLKVQTEARIIDQKLSNNHTKHLRVDCNSNLTLVIDNPPEHSPNVKTVQQLSLPDLCLQQGKLSLQIGNGHHPSGSTNGFCLSSFGTFPSSGHNFHIPDRSLNNNNEHSAEDLINSNCSIDINTTDSNSNVSVDLHIFDDAVSHSDVVIPSPIPPNEDSMLMDNNSNSVYFHCPEVTPSRSRPSASNSPNDNSMTQLQSNCNSTSLLGIGTDKTTWQFVKHQIKTQGINQACGEISEMADKLSKVARDKFIPVREEEVERLGNSAPIIQVDTPFFSHLLDLPFGTYVYKEDAGVRKIIPPPPPTAELSLTGGVEVDIDKFLSPDMDLINLPHLTNLDFTAICNNSS